MSDKVEKRSLVVQLADLLERDIRQGIWSGKLPGNRPLSERYGVNRKTCAAALEVLELRGYVQPAEPGKARIIKTLSGTPQAAAKSKGILLIIHSAVSPLNHHDEALLRGIQEVWESSKGGIVREKVDFDRSQNPAPVLEKLIARHHACALLLHSPQGKWGDVAASRLPTFQLGGSLEDPKKSSMCGYGIARGIEDLVRHLGTFGHERILIPIDPLWSGFRTAVLEGLAKGLGKPPASGTVEDLCPRFNEAVPEVWRSYWKKAFLRIQPTAVIVSEDTQLLSLYGFCNHHGIRIPRDLSIVSLNYESLFDWCQPRPVMLRFPNRKALSHFKDWLAGGMKPIGKIYLPMDILDGESLAEARST